MIRRKLAEALLKWRYFSNFLVRFHAKAEKTAQILALSPLAERIVRNSRGNLRSLAQENLKNIASASSRLITIHANFLIQPDNMIPDRIHLIYEELAAIIGSSNALQLENSPRFEDYLHDETFLKGQAGLILIPPNISALQSIIETLHARRAEYRNLLDHLSLTIRGGGSGLSGACVPESGIVVSMEKINQIENIDEKNMIFSAQAGIILSQINDALLSQNLHYPVDPSSIALCQLGGSIATNAAGPSSYKYGTTRENIAAIRLLTAQGEIVNFGTLPQKTSTGLNLRSLICGSEGRLGIILGADLRIRPLPEQYATALGIFANERTALEFVHTLRRANLPARAIEWLDENALNVAKDFPVAVPQNASALIIEFDGDDREIERWFEKLQTLNPSINWHIAMSQKARHQIWQARKSITMALKNAYRFKLGEDIAVPVSALIQIVNYARAQAWESHIDTAIWGHAGDGNLHVNYLFDSMDKLAIVDTLITDLAKQSVALGGSVSGEHGLGRLKRHLAIYEKSNAELKLEESIIHLMNPNGFLNPALHRNKPHSPEHNLE